MSEFAKSLETLIFFSTYFTFMTLKNWFSCWGFDGPVDELENSLDPQGELENVIGQAFKQYRF